MADVFPSGLDFDSLTQHFKVNARTILDDGVVYVGESRAGRVETSFTILPPGLKHTWHIHSPLLHEEKDKPGADTFKIKEIRGSRTQQKEQIIDELAQREARRALETDQSSFLMPKA